MCMSWRGGGEAQRARVRAALEAEAAAGGAGGQGWPVEQGLAPALAARLQAMRAGQHAPPGSRLHFQQRQQQLRRVDALRCNLALEVEACVPLLDFPYPHPAA